tara:strand:- start:305 stop:712 length:408 start_codon:yes stop_codon:yes gene_type:complete
MTFEVIELPEEMKEEYRYPLTKRCVVDKEKDVYLVHKGGGGSGPPRKCYDLIVEGQKIDVYCGSEMITDILDDKTHLITMVHTVLEISDYSTVNISKDEILALVKQGLEVHGFGGRQDLTKEVIVKNLNKTVFKE